MRNSCLDFEFDIAHYASGAYSEIRNHKAFFDHLRACAKCRKKLFQTEETVRLVRKTQEPPPEYREAMAELLALSERELPPMEDISELKQKAIAFIAQREYARALEYMDKIIAQEPNNAGAYANRGVAYIGLSKLSEALVALTHALELDPKRGEVYGNRGAVYLKLNQPELALADLAKAIELNPQDASHYFARGWTYERLGEYDKAIKDFTKVLELNPRDLRAYIMRGLSYGKMNKSKQAIDDFSQYLSKDPKSYLVYHNRAMAYRSMKEMDKAMVDLKQALKLNPDFTPASLELKALEQGALWQDFESCLKDAKARTDKDRIKELEKELKMLKEQVKSLTELVLQRPANYLYPSMPAYMSETGEKAGEERVPQDLP